MQSQSHNAVPTNWTPEQQAILAHTDSLLAVVAGAGCGKTTTLVGKCVELLKSNPAARFCAVSFTEKSVRDLEQSISTGLRRSSIHSRPGQHWIRTIHGLCGAILRENGRAAGLEGGERILTPEEMAPYWHRSIESLWSRDESEVVGRALETLLAIYSRSTIEMMLTRLRTLDAFGALERFIEPDRDVVQALKIVYDSVALRYRNSKSRAGVLDFQDLEIHALAALQDTKVQRQYQKQFDLVLVDEFQDTNPVQAEILTRFAKDGLRNLLVVGDPKQSIYRFRDADVTVFEEFVQKSRPLPLTVNRRSVPEILDFVNQVCEPLFQGGAMQYDPLRSPSDSAPGGQSVVRWQRDSMEQLADTLKANLDRFGTLGDTAILVRKTTGPTQELLAALRQRKVPVALQGGGRFWEDPRVQELVALLSGWIADSNRLSQATVLRAPWVCVPDEIIVRWSESKTQSLFQQWFEAGSELIAGLLQPLWLRRHQIRPAEIFQVLLDSDQLDEEMRFPVLQLWHYCEDYSANGLRFDAVVDELKKCIEERHRASEVPLPNKVGLVRVMTIHAAKGLQFDNVILVDFADQNHRQLADRTGFYWDRHHGAYLQHLDLDKGTKDDKHPMNIEWSNREAAHRLAESKRLFYVAVTRPKKRLILYWPPAKPEGKTKKKEGEASDRDCWRKWVEGYANVPLEDEATLFLRDQVSDDVGRVVNDGSPSDSPDKKQSNSAGAMQFYRPRHSISEWNKMVKCPRQYAYSAIEGVPEQEAEQERFDVPSDLAEVPARKSLPANELGKILHEILEKEDLARLKIGFGAAGKVYADWIESEKVWDRFPRSARECAFEIPLDEREALVGVIDRLDWDPEKKIFRVIDYKWTITDVSADDLRARYALQLQVYAWAARKLLRADATWKADIRILHFGPTSGAAKGVNWIQLNEDLSVHQTILDLWHQAQNLIQQTRQSIDFASKNAGEICKKCAFLDLCRPFT